MVYNPNVPLVSRRIRPYFLVKGCVFLQGFHPPGIQGTLPERGTQIHRVLCSRPVGPGGVWPVTTRIIACFAEDSYKPSFATVSRKLT